MYIVKLQGGIVMTIGDKIKYFRKRLGLTGDKLAELTGLHPVSIRKYETNKTVPLPPQKQKIADVLGVSVYALEETPAKTLTLNSRGDFIGLLIRLCKNEILLIDGERNEDGALIPKTAAFQVNPLISQFFKANVKKPCSELLFFLNNTFVLDDFLKWEKLYHNYLELSNKYTQSSNNADLDALVQLREAIEKIELELQFSA